MVRAILEARWLARNRGRVCYVVRERGGYIACDYLAWDDTVVIYTFPSGRIHRATVAQ